MNVLVAGFTVALTLVPSAVFAGSDYGAQHAQIQAVLGAPHARVNPRKLRKIGRFAASILQREALFAAQVQHRAAAVALLGHFGEPYAAFVCKQATTNPAVVIRRSAIASCAIASTKHWRKAVQTVAADKDPFVREAAIYTLIHRCDQRARATLSSRKKLEKTAFLQRLLRSVVPASGGLKGTWRCGSTTAR